jgi:hypothetical protein
VPLAVTQLQRPGVVYRRVPAAALGSETSLIWREPAPPVVQRFVAHVRGHRAAPRGPRARTGDNRRPSTS